MATQLKQRKVRVSRAEIEKAREQILKGQTQTKKRHTAEEAVVSWGRDFWRGGIYCDSYGVAWGIDETLNTVRLGKTADVLEATRDIDRDNPGAVIKAVKDYQSVKDQACQSAMETKQVYMCHLDESIQVHGNGSAANHNRAILETDPQFLRLFDTLINHGYGVLTIQNKLKQNGYDIPYRTIGRWVKRRQPCLI